MSFRNNIRGDITEGVFQLGIKQGSKYEFDALLKYYRNAVSVSERLLTLKTLASTPLKPLINKYVLFSLCCFVLFFVKLLITVIHHGEQA